MLKTIRNLLTKQSETFRLLVSFGKGQPVFTEANFEKLAREGYMQNVYVYRCVNIITNTCCLLEREGRPYFLYRNIMGHCLRPGQRFEFENEVEEGWIVTMILCFEKVNPIWEKKEREDLLYSMQSEKVSFNKQVS